MCIELTDGQTDVQTDMVLTCEPAYIGDTELLQTECGFQVNADLFCLFQCNCTTICIDCLFIASFLVVLLQETLLVTVYKTLNSVILSSAIGKLIHEYDNAIPFYFYTNLPKVDCERCDCYFHSVSTCGLLVSDEFHRNRNECV